MNKISVLQVGNEDLSLQLHIPDYVEWNCINDLDEATERSYDVCVLNRCVNKEEAYILLKKIRAYTLFLLDDVKVDQWTTWICTSRRARVLDIRTLQEFIDKDIQLFYSYTYGDKYDQHSL